jgi:hypothetical protein
VPESIFYQTVHAEWDFHFTHGYYIIMRRIMVMTTRGYLKLKLESETGVGLLQLTSPKFISDTESGQ